MAGTLVLSGAVSADQQRRIYDSVVLKVLGARRRDILISLFIEYGFLAFFTILIATVLGTLGGWAILNFVMRAEWIPVYDVVATTMAGATVFMVLIAILATWRSLGRKPASILRNE